MTFHAGSGTSGSQNVKQIFEEVFQAHSQQEQLKAIKKVILRGSRNIIPLNRGLTIILLFSFADQAVLKLTTAILQYW